VGDLEESIDADTWEAGAGLPAPSPPFPLPPPPVEPAPRASSGAVFRLVVAGVAAVGIATAGVLVSASRDGIDYPDEWDPRVADLADFVEGERGESFEHPVAVDFLTPEEYSERTRSDESELTLEDEESLEAAAALFRAFGLAEGEVDLFGSSNDIADTGTLAFYDPVSDSVTVRGTELTVELRVTLVHELTHALQDQIVDLVEMQEDAGEMGSTAVRGLIEGDAVLVERGYVDQVLTADERSAYETASVSASDQATADLGDVPAALLAFFGAPYAFGPPFVLVAEAEGDVDAVFRVPPDTDEHLMAPSRYLADDDPRDIGTPDVDDDVEVLDDGSVGSLAWFLTLAERIDPFQAMTAVDGWGGDAYVLSDDGDSTCVRAVVYGDTERDVEELTTALETWAASLPAGMAKVTATDDGGVDVASCDPGDAADLDVTGRGADALAVPVTRSYLFADAVTVFDPEDAFCVADAAVRGLTLEQLADPAGTVFTDGTFDAISRMAIQGCGLV